MELELVPPFPDEIRRAVAAALAPSSPRVDPWWQAGLDEALDGGPPPNAPRAQGATTARPRKTRGADRA